MNIDDMEGLDEETRKEVEKLQKVTREKDGDEVYALAQLHIGAILVKNDEVNKALSVWSKISHSDDATVFSRAQLNIGNILIKSGDYKAALAAWSNIKRVYDVNIYGQAQFNIGLALLKNGDTKDALLAWRNIDSEDSAVMYRQAQFNIGVALERSGDIKGALSAWTKIDNKGNKKIYGQAQINIGNALLKSDDLESALRVWRTLEVHDDIEMYALAQLNIGIALDRNNNTKSALEAWSNIKSAYSLETYAKAQLSIGIALEENGEIEKALSIWVNNIGRLNDRKIYAKAQIAIGHTLEQNYGTEKALLVWPEVDIVDCPEMYAVAQYKTALHLINDNKAKEYIDAKKAFSNADLVYPYEAYCYEKICDLLSISKTENIGKKLLKLFDRVLNIIDILKLDFGQESDEDKLPERKLAHYTGTYTTNKLLAIDENSNISSAFRLNTINNVNDPSEGKLLVNYLKNIQKKDFYSSDFDKNLHAFISCFTFNHDSLNQFRLYGKQDNKEASGLSLVFNKEFFQPYGSLKGLSFLPPKNNFQESNNEFSNQKTSDEIKVAQSTEIKYRINKQPVMRCVYLDPTSNFTQLAQRNKLTFYREFGNEKTQEEVDGVTKEKSRAEAEWMKYINDIKKKTKFFHKEFKFLKKAYKKVMNARAVVGNCDQNFLDEMEVLLDEILLPLKYLIKHSAFQEEQECRMIYITSLEDPKVKIDFGRFLFVEYEADVKSHLDKIYIAPAATQYQPYLAKLLCDTDVKIELSNNPYRQT